MESTKKDGCNFNCIEEKETTNEQRRGKISSQIGIVHPVKVNENAYSVNDISIKFEELFNQCKKAYSDHLLDEAYRLMLICKHFKQKNQEFEQKDILTEKKTLFETIENDYIQMNAFLYEMKDSQGWISENLSSSTKFHYKQNPKNEMLCLKVEIDVDIPIQIMFAMLYEIDFWNLWMPFLKKTKELAKIHRGALIYEMEFGLPYPLNNRRGLLFGKGFNRLAENGTILILSKSIHSDAAFLEKYDIKTIPNPSFVNVDFHFGGFELTPLGTNKCRLKGVAKVNPKLKWIPDSMLTFLFKKGLQYGTEKLVNKAKNYKGSVWEQQALSGEKKNFYSCFNQRIMDYHQSKNQNQLLPKL